MKIRLLQASFLAAFLIFLSALTTAGYAFPVIHNLSLQEPSLWLGETETIFLNCTDDNSTALEMPYADITTASAIFPNNAFNPISDSNWNYYLAIPTTSASNFYKIGVFNATVFCKNALGESANSSVSFIVSNLSIETSKAVSPVYIGDVEETDVFVKKDGGVITSDINFSIALDGADVALLSQPYYDFANGWILRFSTAGQAAGTKTLSITANYGRASVSSVSEIMISDAIESSFLGIDKTWISANDPITLQLRAIERGSAVQIKKEQLAIQMDSTSAAITEITPAAGGVYNVKFGAPSMSAGSHTLKATFNYNNFSDSYSKSVSYTIPVKGNIFLASEKSATVQLKFISGDASTVTVKADGSGAYSALLPPAEYTIQITDGTPMLEIFDAAIDAGIDPEDAGIKYQPVVSGTVSGIQGAGIYYYGAAFDYSSAHLKLPYDQGKINDESQIQAYVCENWNSGKKTCLTDWRTIDSKIDTVRKAANIDSAELNSAYIIGSPDGASIEASAEKDTYALSEKIKIAGIILDGAKNTIPEASIAASLSGLPIIASAKSNAQGVFSLELDNPGAEGAYTAILAVSKTPYISSQKQIKFTVVKTADLTISGPDTIRMYPGDATDVQFRLINVGEADLNNMAVSIKGLPSNYYRIMPPESVDAIKSGAEKSMPVHFEIPAGAAKATFGASFEVSKGEFSKVYNFALTVLAPANTTGTTGSVIITQAQAPAINDAPSKPAANSLSFSMPTAFSTLSIAQSDAAYIAEFAAVSFSAALLLRRKRLLSKKYSVGGKKSVHRNIIFEIKNKVSESERMRERNAKGRRAAAHVSRYAKRW